ncbi:MAG: helix-turn-helix domain-containing protein [Lactobacillales bacterium]|nr:helix-turn-helix domain-containing protein [Lactobacillales bacterium]
MDNGFNFSDFQFNLGEFFKNLRENKGLTQEQACKGVCSRRTLSNIENGLITNLKQMVYLSEKLEFPSNEAILAASGYPEDRLEAFLDQVKTYFNEKNISALQDMLEKKQKASLTNKENYLHILSLSDYIYYLDSNCPIAKSDIINATDYLDRLEEWNYINVRLFGQIAHLLNINLVCSFTKDIIKYHKNIFMVNNLKKHRLIQVLNNVIHYCLDEGHLAYVEYFLKTVFSLVLRPTRLPEHIGDSIFLDYEYGRYLLIAENKKDGLKIMRDTINALSMCGYEDLANKFQQNYNETIIKLDKYQSSMTLSSKVCN